MCFGLKKKFGDDSDLWRSTHAAEHAACTPVSVLEARLKCDSAFLELRF
jgi:hypothetical protein